MKNLHLTMIAFAAVSLGLWAAAPASAAQTQYQVSPDSLPQPGVPKGDMLQFPLTGTKYYPGTKSTIWVYVPAEYTPEKPACLCVGLDGPGFSAPTVFDNLIYKKQMPVTIGVFISPGTVNKPGTNDPVRFDRCYEFDSTNDNFDRFMVEEVLPAVEQQKTKDGRAIHISPDPNDHMICGGSSGGVCAFTAAWQHPDLFRRVFTAIGTYVGMRGADMYPTLVRKTEPKSIRIFLQDGAQDTWNPLFDNWYTQNRSMEESLAFAGYDVNHSWGTLGHEGSHADSVFPDVVKWLWRDYPQPITAGWSGNSMLHTILVQGQDWQPVATGGSSPTALCVDQQGHLYYTDPANNTIYRLGESGKPELFTHAPATVTAEQFGLDGRLYAATADGTISAYDVAGKATLIANGIHAAGLYVSSDGALYATEPGAHDDDPSKVWLIPTTAPAATHPAGALSPASRLAASGRIRQLGPIRPITHTPTHPYNRVLIQAGHSPAATAQLLDSGIHHATGILLTPDHNLLFVAEGHSHWIYSFVNPAEGPLEDKQRFYWLHTAESADDSGDYSDTTDLAEDSQGSLYAATRMGVQVCDRNGRVEGILTLPAGQVNSLCFGGPDFKTLYVTCGGKLYRRSMNVAGVPNWAKPIQLPGFGAG